MSEFKFGIPPSVGREDAGHRAEFLAAYLGHALGKRVTVRVASDYRALKSDLISGELVAAWGPPYVCARTEAYGGRGLVRGMRRGAATYRSALVSLAGRKIQIGQAVLKLAWVDPDSVAGYLLPLAFLREHAAAGFQHIASEKFYGSYRAAVQAVLDRSADLAPIWASSGVPEQPVPALLELAGPRADELEVVAFSRDCPNDGVVLSPFIDSAVVPILERIFLTMDQESEGRTILKDVFGAEKFERAPPGSYLSLNQLVFTG